jgi:FixJ family two-component response regulator
MLGHMSTRATRVAVVDDDASVRKALARLLSARSFQPETFASAREFLESLTAKPPPDCLVLDLHMPGMTGLELQRHLAARKLAIPTVVITAQDDPRLLHLCRTAGAAAVLSKPLDGSVLMGAIEAAVGGPMSPGANGDERHA